MSVHKSLGSGVYRQGPTVIEEQSRKSKTPQQQMQTLNGWFTFFAGTWCWLHYGKSRKNSGCARPKFYAVVMGRKGRTPDTDSMEELAQFVKKGVRVPDTRDCVDKRRP